MSSVTKPDQAPSNSADATTNAPPTSKGKAAQRREENQYWGMKLTEAIRDNNKENVKAIIKNKLASVYLSIFCLAKIPQFDRNAIVTLTRLILHFNCRPL